MRRTAPARPDSDGEGVAVKGDVTVFASGVGVCRTRRREYGLPSAWPRVLLRVAASAPDAVLNGGA